MARRNPTEQELQSIIRGRRWNAAQAAVVVAAATASGLPLRTFAARHGLDPLRLYRWRRQLRESVSAEKVSFEEIVVPSTTASSLVDDTRIEMVLHSGRVIRVGRSFDEATLRRLVVILEEQGAC